MALLTKTHDWNMIRLTPVEVIPDDRGEPKVFQLEAGEERIGCMSCDSPLTAEALKSDCPGEP